MLCFMVSDTGGRDKKEECMRLASLWVVCFIRNKPDRFFAWYDGGTRLEPQIRSASSNYI